MHSIQYGKGIVLSYYLVGTAFKFIGIILCPPIAQGAIGIILAALIVKTVGHFVPDHRTYTTIVHRIISTKIKKWKLQYPGRECNSISGWAIGSINSGRSHTPPGFINRFTQLADIIIIAPF